MKIAVIDIGTNTCHLLIGQIDKSIEGIHQLNIILKKRHYTYLAESGMSYIGLPQQKRLFDALTDFNNLIQMQEVNHVKIIATEGLRMASNGNIIQRQILLNFSWNVDIISGEQEAKYLFTAAKSSIDLKGGQHLIVDIGGGSTEFILTDNGHIIKSESLPLGIARLHSAFQEHDPIDHSEINAINEHVTEKLMPFLSAIKRPLSLVGMAGTFEILEENIPLHSIDQYNTFIDLQRAPAFIDEIIKLDFRTRKSHPAVPKVRATYVVVALVLISTLIKLFSPDEFVVSKFSIKEGVAIDEYANKR